MILFKLFFAFLRVGFFAVGGAYSFLPLIEREVVEKYNWLSREEFLDVLGIVKIFPGAISIKYATYTGYKLAGIKGAVVANAANLLAPASLIFFASLFYMKYKDSDVLKGSFNMVQLVVFAMIISVAFQLINPHQIIQPRNLLIVITAFILFLYTKIHPAFIIICAALLGAFLK